MVLKQCFNSFRRLILGRRWREGKWFGNLNGKKLALLLIKKVRRLIVNLRTDYICISVSCLLVLQQIANLREQFLLVSWLWIRCRSSWFLFLLLREFVDTFYHHEYTESDDDKVK